MTQVVQARQVYVTVKQKAQRWMTSTDALVSFFAACGKPSSVVNKYGEASERIKEVALVTFSKTKAVQKAIALSGTQLDGREVTIGLNTRAPKTRGQPCTSVRVFCGNLPFEADDAMVRERFDQCGKVLFVRFGLDEAGQPRGFCHVIFEDPTGDGQPAKLALSLDGEEMSGRSITVKEAIQKPKPHADSGKRDRTTDSADDVNVDNFSRKKPAPWRHDKKTGLTEPLSHEGYGSKNTADTDRLWRREEF